jgi:hypothetical protein
MGVDVAGWCGSSGCADGRECLSARIEDVKALLQTGAGQKPGSAGADQNPKAGGVDETDPTHVDNQK